MNLTTWRGSRAVWSAMEAFSDPSGVALLMGVLGCLLVAGLWPFGRPPNELQWLGDRDGVRYRRHTTILSSSALPQAGGLCTIEMRLFPLSSRQDGQLLGFFDELGARGFSLNQSLGDLRVDRWTASGKREFYVENVFRNPTALITLTVVSGTQGAFVFVNGSRVGRLVGFHRAAKDCSGSFVIGDSPVEHDGWKGDLLGLAIYQRALRSEEVRAHSLSWAKQGKPDWDGNDPPTVLYYFDERNGRAVQDHGSSGITLQIPERYQVAHQRLLQLPADAFKFEWPYLWDILLNIVGFVPFGFLMCTRIGWRRRRSVFWTVLIGLAISLMIEVLQSRLPTRNSDLTDVITNTIGTWIGASGRKFWSEQLSRCLAPALCAELSASAHPRTTRGI